MKPSTIAILSAIVILIGVMLHPELSISRHPINDDVLHYSASLAQAERPTLDGWFGTCCMGYPLWVSYQPIPHIATGLLMRVLPFDHVTVYLWIKYLMLCLLPLGFYAVARAIGIGEIGAVSAAALSYMPSESGAFGPFGINYGSYIWRGSGLYTQLWGFAVGLPALAYGLRAVRRGRGLVGAGVLMAAAVLSHLVVGFIMAVSLVVIVLVRHRGNPMFRRRLKNLAMIALVAVLLTLWLFVPMALAWKSVGPGENATQSWQANSFGAQFIVSSVANGSLLDGLRFPMLTCLLLAGAILAICRWKRCRASQSLLALAGYWLACWWGPATWGRVLAPLGVVQQIQPHRFQLAFEMWAVMLAGMAVEFVYCKIRGHRA